MSGLVMPASSSPSSLIVHGGAGDWSAEDGDGEALVAACRAAARAGFEILRAGGSALDAATAAVVVLEDNPRFNAGTGSALTVEGEVECDASIMCGDGRAGAVGALRDVKNPIRLARLVMERTPHVLLVGAGAAAFAAECGLPPLRPEALVTERMREKWRAAVARAAPGPPRRDRRLRGARRSRSRRRRDVDRRDDARSGRGGWGTRR